MLQWIDMENGRCKSKSAGTDDPKAAGIKRSDHECELNNGRHQEPSKLGWQRFRELLFKDSSAAA
jgi:hypothetical protein